MKKFILTAIVALVLAFSLVSCVGSFGVGKTYYVESISITSDTPALTGSELIIKPTILPNYATNTNLKWISSNDLIATVNNGIVKCISPGNVNITAISTDGSNKHATCTITIIDEVYFNYENYQEIVTLDSTFNQSLLFTNANIWIAEYFKSANNVIQMSDKEAGILIVKGLIDGNLGDIYFSLKIETKNAKYRYTFYDYIFEETTDRYISKYHQSMVREALNDKKEASILLMITTLKEKLNSKNDF